MHLKLKDGQKGCDLFLMTANLHSDMARVGARWMCNAAMLSLTWPRPLMKGLREHMLRCHS